MKYANTYPNRGIEVVLVVFPLSSVPAFNVEDPPPQSYSVPDEVQPGWVRDASGAFRPQTAAEQRKLSIPTTVTEYQAKSALMQASHASGKDCYAVVEAYMATPQAPAQIKLAWATCRDYERMDPKIYLIARNVLQIPEAELEDWLDTMFLKAKVIT